MSRELHMFQNSGYNNDRNKIKTLILDVRDGIVTLDGTPTTVTHLSNASEFNIKLFVISWHIDQHQFQSRIEY